MRKIFPKRFNRAIATLALTLLLLGGLTLSQPQAATTEITFTILHTNDEHSALIPTPLTDDHPTQANQSLGGFARLAAAVGEIRTAKGIQGEAVLLLSAGDYMGGSAFSWLSLVGHAPELSLMRELGYDVVTIGNHEYDYGPEVLAEYLAAAGYPSSSESKPVIVASNTHPPPNHPLADRGIQDIYVKDLGNGLKVGFLGLLGKDAIQVAPGSSPIEFSDQHEAAGEAVGKLQDAGADIIIALTHSGVEEDRELARAYPEINIIIGGHCHTALDKPLMEGETVIVQSGSLLQYLGILEMAYEPASGKLRVRNGETGRPHLLALGYTIPAEPVMAALVERYTAELNALVRRMSGGVFDDISEIVVYTAPDIPNTPPLQESPMGNFVTDAMRLKAQDVLGEKVDFAFQANGVIRGPIISSSVAFAEDGVSFYDLVNLVGLGSGPDGQPGYPLVSVYLTGEEVRRVLEISVLLSELMGDTYYLQMSGVRMTYDPDRAILFWIPIKNLPLPTSRAVLSAERYTGEGMQEEEDSFVPLKKGDEELYHLVTDYYIASFLPMVGEMLPNLGLVPKDREGNPVDIDDAIVYRDGQELKVWQAVVEYAAAQPEDIFGNPRIAEAYSRPAGRIRQVETLPLLLWPLLGAGLLMAFVIRLLYRRRKRRQSRTY
jgi:5'-nucleotidase / UDP-sugar diphosphatase